MQQGDLFNHFMSALLQYEDVTALWSNKHFSGNCTLVEALAGHKIFKPNDDTGSDGSTSTARHVRMTRAQARLIPTAACPVNQMARSGYSAT